MTPWETAFLSKNRHLGVPKSLGGGFGTLLGDIENSKFFDVALGCQKIDKIRSLDAQGLKKGLRVFPGGTLGRF